MARKKNVTIKQGLDGWVMTYGDMMSLLLTFFVLIVSFSSMQETKFQQAAASLRDAFGVLATPESVIQFNEPLVPDHNPDSEEAEVLYEVRGVEKMILEEGLEKQVEVEVQEDGVLFRLNAPFLFKSGRAELAEEPKGLLREMAKFFTKFPYSIQVEGHTDSIPMHSAEFPSNWELSAGRAVTVARYFQSLSMPPERLSATGYGEFRPIADNGTAEGRERNRRVEVFLHLDKDDLPRNNTLPLVDEGVPVTEVDPGTGSEAASNPPEQKDFKPVTESLGSLPDGN